MRKTILLTFSTFLRLINFGRVFSFYKTFLILMLTPVAYSQYSTGVQPTPIPGSNSVVFQSSTNKYLFYHNGILRYEYGVPPGTTTNGGSFNVLKAYADNGTTFLPSNFGGITAYLSGYEMGPWDIGVSFTRISHQKLTDGTVIAYWQMTYKGDFIKYKYKIQIQGRTLIIRVEVDDVASYRNKVRRFDLDRSELAQTRPEAIAVPYLPFFHILLSNGIYTSFFTDWEISNASQFIPYDPSIRFNENYSIRYSQFMLYNKRTDKFNYDYGRNRLIETLYLTTSPNLEDVLPNIPNPESTYKNQVADQIVWDYRRPFGRLNNPWTAPSGQITGDFLDRLWNAGVSNLWVQIHDWQHYHNHVCIADPTLKSGYDDGLPCVLAANELYEYGAEYGGQDSLNSVISKARQYGYRIGLHQNYVDYYPNSTDCGWWHEDNLALGSNGQPIPAFYNGNCTHIQSYLLKPSMASYFVNYWSHNIQLQHPNLNGSYLDVHSSIVPVTNYVDYDYTELVTNAGKFRETLQAYRGLYDILKTNHNGPVQGEGGNLPFYIGYVDDIEARLITPQKWFKLYEIPPLIDFDMLKLRSKTMVHGVCWYPLWIGTPPNFTERATREEVLSYIATELAFGHGAYLCDEYDIDFNQTDFITHAQWKYNHVFSVQKDYAFVSPSQILYNDNGVMKTASDYIRAHPVTYQDISSNDFMGQVKVEYNNGLIVYVNRHPTRTWTVNVGIPNAWFNYHTTTELSTGTRPSSTFHLPANNGWVVFDPLKGLAANISGPSEINHPNKGQPPIQYTWNIQVVGGTSPYTYQWKWDGIPVGTGTSYSKTLRYDGYYPPQQHTLICEVRDASVPQQFVAPQKAITEYSAGWTKLNKEGEQLPKVFALNQNYPNPFNPTTTISFELPEQSNVKLIIYDILGREVVTLEDGSFEAGYYSKTWTCVDSHNTNVGSGIYIYRITAHGINGQDFSKVMKMIVVK
ncbi:MAG: T9SS type A sorting domain-containing protein [Ignavibacteriaceae bacterium]|jgi:hypothetical protein|nr:T9SS type A sorting domain-containing protein [Ignavibacteriaceae bacterium]